MKATLLTHLDPKCKQLHLITDASNVAVGGVLQQVKADGSSEPLGFFSKKLTVPQTAYSTFDRELLAAYLAVLHFKHILEGVTATLFSDHKPFVSAFHSAKEAKSDRQQRHLAIIAEYIYDVKYIKGSENVTADCLSRSINAVHADVFDLEGIAQLQVTDSEIMDYKQKLTKYPLPSGIDILCDTSITAPRPFLPKQCRYRIFDQFHNISQV